MSISVVLKSFKKDFLFGYIEPNGMIRNMNLTSKFITSQPG